MNQSTQNNWEFPTVYMSFLSIHTKRFCRFIKLSFRPCFITMSFERVVLFVVHELLCVGTTQHSFITYPLPVQLFMSLWDHRLIDYELWYNVMFAFPKWRIMVKIVWTVKSLINLTCTSLALVIGSKPAGLKKNNNNNIFHNEWFVYIVLNYEFIKSNYQIKLL